MSLAEAIAAISAGPVQIAGSPGMLERAAEIILSGVSTDTRSLTPSDLFVALKGENFNGEDYLDVALDKGAAATIISSENFLATRHETVLAIGVADTLVAYGEIARAWRRKFTVPVIGVTGSVGKTTTKEMLAAALSPLGPILKTEKNENNEIGVPQLLLRLDDTHTAAVVEMGMRGAGQIEYLAKIAEPTIAVISRIGENHIELLGSMDAIADAKGELIEALPPLGLAVLNADDPYLPRLQQKAKHCRAATYGFSEGADLRATDARLDSTGEAWDVVVQGDGRSVALRVPSPSRHDISNALAAILVAVSLGVTLESACEALGNYQNVGMRMEVIKTPVGATILSDCYNAAPTSMRSALDTLASFPSESGRRLAFLGDMRELGDFAPEMHAEVVAHAELLHLSELYAVGPVSSAQMVRADRTFEESAQAAEWALGSLNLQPGDVILVKGSRAMAMERIVGVLRS